MSDHGGGGNGLPLYGLVEHQMHGAHEGGIHLQIRPVVIAFVVLLVGFLIMSPAQMGANVTFAVFSLPFWLPFILGRFAVLRFLHMRRAEFLLKQEYVLLELRLPRDTMKTPMAMEAVLSAMYFGPGETNWYARLIKGGVRQWYSLEMASLGGRVHFYVWTRVGFRRAIESAFYAQYPDMEIVEAVDYSRLIDPSHAPYQMTGFEYKHNIPDVWPLKTYVDYGLDKVQKPEEQIDPLAQIVELLGSLGPTEQMWIQYIIRTNKNEKYRGRKKPDGKLYKFADEAAEEIEKVRTSVVRKTTRLDAEGNPFETESFPNPTKGDQEGIWAIQRKQGKLTFDTGVRVIYMAPKETFQGIMGAFMVGLYKPFSYDANGNTLRLQDRFSSRYGNYPWDDPGGHHQAHADHELTEYYRRRAYFYDPYRGDWNIMSTEELATLFHIPSASIATPGLPRINSSTGGAPVDLPT